MPTDTGHHVGVPMPRYKPTPKVTSEKGEDNMYPMTKLHFSVNDVQGRYEDVMGPLSLFAPYPHEDEPPQVELNLERPITPINDDIKSPPPTFQKLAKLIRRRISARNDVPYLSMEDQQALAAVLMGEANGIWADLRQQVDDPFLTEQENRELQRRISVHIVTVCEQLFLHYLHKAQILNKRGVFSGPANMSRLKAQLALDANKFLNVLAVRRHIVNDLRGQAARDSDSDNEAKIPAPPKISHKGFKTSDMDVARPKARGRRLKNLTTQQHLREIKDKMPCLETDRLLVLLEDLPHPSRTDSQQSVSISADTPVKNVKATRMTQSQSESHDETKGKMLMRKSESVPLLTFGETLLEELGISEKEVEQGRVTSIGTEDVPELNTVRDQPKKKSERAVNDTRQQVKDDLQRLITQPDVLDVPGQQPDEDLPPLIQALTRSAKHDGRKEEIEQEMKELKEKERIREEEEKIEIRPPTHPQPATVSTRLPNQMMVRTSDVRVSERICMSNVTLTQYSTVYNDLIDEIDPDTVKQLDSNLFLGEEIKEVYKEIMKTVPSDHLLLENDDLVEAAATDSVNLSGALASSTLSRPKRERIINSNLTASRNPPWGEMPLQDWAKTSGNAKKENQDKKTTDQKNGQPEPAVRSEGYGSNGYIAKGAPDTSDMPPMMAEIASRSYASWLAWWKNTINSDDYMKYLSTQETDYMGAIFHFYDSDDEGDEDYDDGMMTRRSGSRQALLNSKHQQIKEREEKKKELERQKTDYQEGMWNVNSILLGGLGKDPLHDEDDGPASVRLSVAEDDRKSKTPRSKTVIMSRKSRQEQLELEREENLKTRSGESERAATSLSKKTSGPPSQAGTKRSGSTAEQILPEASGPTDQDRLEKVWSKLRMPDNKKLDMAIKYSSDEYHSRLSEAINWWEKATDLILQRETVLAKLEAFERLASDPNRFFERGYRGSSVARLDEAKVRSNFYKKIDICDKELKKILEYVKETFNDTISYQGRPYTDKIHWDRTEMLYWLQEERKEQAMEYESRVKTAPLSMAQLQPITPSV